MMVVVAPLSEVLCLHLTLVSKSIPEPHLKVAWSLEHPKEHDQSTAPW
jgi:hypothetical protein